jgi:hypothetical protein
LVVGIGGKLLSLFFLLVTSGLWKRVLLHDAEEVVGLLFLGLEGVSFRFVVDQSWSCLARC